MIPWKIISKKSQEVRALLKLVSIEFCKLRRKKQIWLMLLSAWIMPFFAFLYFGYLGQKDIDPAAFYKWSSYNYTLFIILPFVLGLFATMLMHDENRYDMLKQLWIVPVSKMGLLFSKFFVVLIYGICFMLLNVFASVLFSVLPHYVAFDWGDILRLLERSIEIAVLTAVAILPVFALSASQKGYIFPVCVTLIYVFAGVFITPVNSCIHPLSCVFVIIARNGTLSGFTLPQTNVSIALISLCIWGIASVLFANIKLSKRK